MAGVCASIAVARLGYNVALIQDRSVLGGNSSSEIRVAISGAGSVHKNARETGIIEELLTGCLKSPCTLKQDHFLRSGYVRVRRDRVKN